MTTKLASTIAALEGELRVALGGDGGDVGQVAGEGLDRQVLDLTFH